MRNVAVFFAISIAVLLWLSRGDAAPQANPPTLRPISSIAEELNKDGTFSEEDAKTIALQASRIDMAEQALRICTPKPVQAAVKTQTPSAAPHRASQQASAKQSTPIITTPVELPFDETLIVAVKERRIDCALALNAVRKTGDQGQAFRVQQFCTGH